MKRQTSMLLGAALMGLVIAQHATAGIAMNATANGGALRSNNNVNFSDNIVKLVVSESNALNRSINLTDMVSPVDAIGGLASTDVKARGYLQRGPDDAMVVFDFMARQTLAQVIGFQEYKLFVPKPGQRGIDGLVTSSILSSGFGAQAGGGEEPTATASREPGRMPPNTEFSTVPEPSTGLTLLAGCFATLLARPNRKRMPSTRAA